MKFKVGDIIKNTNDHVDLTGRVVGITNHGHPYNIEWDNIQWERKKTPSEKTLSNGHSVSYIEGNFTLKYPRNSHTKLGKVLYK